MRIRKLVTALLATATSLGAVGCAETTDGRAVGSADATQYKLANAALEAAHYPCGRLPRGNPDPADVIHNEPGKPYVSVRWPAGWVKNGSKEPIPLYAKQRPNGFVDGILTATVTETRSASSEVTLNRWVAEQSVIGQVVVKKPVTKCGLPAVHLEIKHPINPKSPKPIHLLDIFEAVAFENGAETWLIVTQFAHREAGTPPDVIEAGRKFSETVFFQSKPPA